MGKSERRRAPSRKKGAENPNETIDALGYHRMVEGKPGVRRSKPVSIADILPQIIARYGLGRRLSAQRFEEAFRKILADLNKQEGTNKAAELIKAAGYDKLSEVPDDALAGIVEQAEQLLGRA